MTAEDDVRDEDGYFGDDPRPIDPAGSPGAAPPTPAKVRRRSVAGDDEGRPEPDRSNRWVVLLLAPAALAAFLVVPELAGYEAAGAFALGVVATAVGLASWGLLDSSPVETLRAKVLSAAGALAFALLAVWLGRRLGGVGGLAMYAIAALCLLIAVGFFVNDDGDAAA